MKGSTYDRETSGEDLKDLKDMNFLALDQQIYVKPHI